MASLDVKRKDTICALATPPGRSALAVIRVSGPASQRVLEAVFLPRHGKQQRPFVATLGDVVEPITLEDPAHTLQETGSHASPSNTVTQDTSQENPCSGGKASLLFPPESSPHPARKAPYFPCPPLATPDASRSTSICRKLGRQTLEEGVCIFYPPGRSYTGEASFELSLHGNPLLVDVVLRVLQQAGCRLAEPGEFSLRAVLTGKLDLCKAQAVYDLIHARSTRAAQAALRTLHGGLSEQLNAARTSIVDALSEIEARLDFPEDDLGEVDPHDHLKQPLEQTAATLERLLQSAALGERLQQGARVVLCGRPNAGKSTLLNTLLGTDKALVHASPGTTRDVIEALWELDGVPITLVDVAGLRAQQQANPVEALGIAKARQELAKADLVLWLTECKRLTTKGSIRDMNPSESFDARDMAPKIRVLDEEIASILAPIDVPILYVCTKTDQLSCHVSAWENNAVVGISARTGKGLESLQKQLQNALVPDGIAHEEALLSTARQRQLVTEAHQMLQQALQALHQRCFAEVVALQLRLCGVALDELLGGNLNEEVLKAIFSRFCIGK